MALVTPKWARPNAGRFKRSQRAERAAAEALDGRVLPRSGGMPAVASDPGGPTMEGDFRTRVLHCEHKRTELDRLALEHAWFVKVSKGASRCHRVPAVVVLFEAGPTEWVFLPLAYFQTVTGCVTGPRRFVGEAVEVTRASRVLRHADLQRLAAEAGHLVPTLAVSWAADPVPERRVWVGVPLAQIREYVTGDGDA